MLADDPSLLDAGAEVDPRDDRQRTPFWHGAWQNDEFGVLSLLLDQGADVNAVGFLNQPPLQTARSNQREAVIDFVLDNGASLPTETGPRFQLMYSAATNGSSRVFNLNG